MFLLIGAVSKGEQPKLKHLRKLRSAIATNAPKY